MTLNEQIERTRSYIDERSEKNFTNTFIIESLNVAQNAIQSYIVDMNVGYFEKLATLNASEEVPGVEIGVSRYALPDDFISFRRVKNGDTGVPLTPIDANEETEGSYGSLAGRLMGTVDGYRYYRSGNEMVIDPTPTVQFPVSMLYVARVAQLTSSSLGTVVPELPLQFHNMMCLDAAIDCRIKDESSPAALERLRARELQRLENTIGNWQTQHPNMVGGSDNY